MLIIINQFKQIYWLLIQFHHYLLHRLGSLSAKLEFNEPFASVCTFTDETQQKDKNFLDLLKIPGCALLFIHSVIIFVTGTSRISGISEYMQSQV